VVQGTAFTLSSFLESRGAATSKVLPRALAAMDDDMWNNARREYLRSLCKDADRSLREWKLPRHTYLRLSDMMNDHFYAGQPRRYHYMHVWDQINRDWNYYGRKGALIEMGPLERLPDCTNRPGWYDY
jgi:hypothetical protein